MFINVRQRPNTVGLLVGADARTSVPTVRMCGELMLGDCSLVARPTQGAAITDVCLVERPQIRAEST